MVCSSSLLPAPGMPASTIRRPSVPPASTSNGPPAARPIGARSCPRCAFQRSATAAADGSGSSSRSRSDTAAGIAPANSGAPASVTGARRRASSSAASGAIASAVTSSRCVPPRTSVSFSRATDGSSSTTHVHEPGSSRTPRPSQITPPPAATAPDSRPGSSPQVAVHYDEGTPAVLGDVLEQLARSRGAFDEVAGSHVRKPLEPVPVAAVAARAAAISTSAGLWSVAACASSQRARPATSAGVPATPRTLPPSGTVTGIAVSIALSSSSRDRLLAQLGVAAAWKLDSDVRREVGGADAQQQRVLVARAALPQLGQQLGGAAMELRRVGRRLAADDLLGRPCLAQAGHGDIQIAPEVRDRGLVAVAAGAPALEVRVDDHGRRQQREREEQEVSGDRRHGATEGKRDQRGAERKRAALALKGRGGRRRDGRGSGARHPGRTVERDPAARSRRHRPCAGVRLDDEQGASRLDLLAVEQCARQLHGGAGDVGAVGRAGVVDGDLVRPHLDHEMAAGHGAVGELDVHTRPAADGVRALCEGDPRAGDRAADGDQVDDCAGLGGRPVLSVRRRQQLDDVAVADVDLTGGRARGPRPAARAGGAGADPEVAGERRDQLVDGRGLGAVDDEVVGASLGRRDGQAQPHSTL